MQSLDQKHGMCQVYVDVSPLTLDMDYPPSSQT
jgi:hypothetical protein